MRFPAVRRGKGNGSKEATVRRMTLGLFAMAALIAAPSAAEDEEPNFAEDLGITIDEEWEGSNEIPDEAEFDEEITTREIRGFLIVKNVGNRGCYISRGRRGYNLLGYVRARKTQVFGLWTKKKSTLLWAHRGRSKGKPTRVVAKRATSPKLHLTYRWTIRCNR